jgi:hypothetical protein
VNGLLSSGEVGGLFQPQEIEPLLSALRDDFRNDGFGHRNGKVRVSVSVIVCLFVFFFRLIVWLFRLQEVESLLAAVGNDYRND